LRDFDEAVERDKASGEAYAGRGFARVKLGQWREGVADARKALQGKGDKPSLFYAGARTLAQASSPRSGLPVPVREAHLKEAVEYLERALELMRDTRRSRFWREKVERDGELDPLRSSPLYARLASRYGGRK
jgi:tetratricopeptide (TPR) repeat protein